MAAYTWNVTNPNGHDGDMVLDNIHLLTYLAVTHLQLTMTVAV